MNNKERNHPIFPLVVEAWKEQGFGKKSLEASTVVDEEDELQRFRERWVHHKLTTRPLNKKEKKARGIEVRRSWFSKLFS